MFWISTLSAFSLVLLVDRLWRLSTLTVGSLRCQFGGDGDGAVVGALPLGDADLVTGTAGVMRPVSFVVPVAVDTEVDQLSRTIEGLLSITTPQHEVLLVTPGETWRNVARELPETLRPSYTVEPLLDRRLADRGAVLWEARVDERPGLRWLATDGGACDSERLRARALNVAVNAARYSLLMQCAAGTVVPGDTVRRLIRGVLLRGSTAAGVARSVFLGGGILARWRRNLLELRTFAPNAARTESVARSDAPVLWRRHALLGAGGAAEESADWLQALRLRLAEREVDGRSSRIDRFRNAVVEDRRELLDEAGGFGLASRKAGPRVGVSASRATLLALVELCVLVLCLSWLLVGRPHSSDLLPLVLVALTLLIVVPVVQDLTLALFEDLNRPESARGDPPLFGVLVAAIWDRLVGRPGAVLQLLGVAARPALHSHR